MIDLYWTFGGHGCLTDFFPVISDHSLKTDVCSRPFSSYRASFEAPVDQWDTVRIPWDRFSGHGPGASETAFDTSSLKRAGIVAIGQEMKVVLAVAGFRFYNSS